MPEGASVGTAYLEIVPSAQGFVSKLNAEVGSDMAKAGQNAGQQAATGMKKSFGSSIKGLFALAGGAALGAGAVSFVKDAFGEAREAQKVGALSAAVIKSTGGAAKISAEQVGDLAGAISAKTGIDDEAVQSGANLLLTFKNIRNETGKGNDIFNQATQASVDMASAMAAASGGQVDFRSSSTMLGKALNDPIKGLAAMGRVGIQFSESQKESIKKMVESGDTMGAQKAILKELNNQFGGAAESQATAADKAGVAWGNLKEQIGTKLLPVADKVSTWATDDLIPALSDAANWIDKNKTAIGGVAVALGTALVVGKAYSIATGIIAAIQAAQAVAAGNATVAQVALNTAMRANLMGLAVAALAALVAGLIYAYKNSETFRNAVNGLWSTCRKVFAFIVDKWLWVAGVLVKGAAKAFGWVPGLGPKLKGAAAKFDKFREDVNRSLGGIHDKNINVNVKAHMPKVLSDKGIKDWQVFGGARAAGGPVRSGSAYLVGENGPELFTARQSGRIVPNHKLAASASALGSGATMTPIAVYIDGIEFPAYLDARIDDRIGA